MGEISPHQLLLIRVSSGNCFREKTGKYRALGDGPVNECFTRQFFKNRV